MTWLTGAAAFVAAIVALSAAPATAQVTKGFVTISPTAMNVDGHNEDVGYTVSASGDVLKVNDDAPRSRCFVTSVDAPDLAVLNKLRVWAVGKTNSGVAITLISLRLGFDEGRTLFSGTRGDESGQRASIIVPLLYGDQVSTIKTVYSFSICLDPGESFNGARVDYAVYGPGGAQAAEKGGVNISHMAFHAGTGSPDVRFLMSNFDVALEGSDASARRCFSTGVNLPADRKLQMLKIWGKIVSPERVSVTLNSLDLKSGSTTNVIQTTFGDEIDRWREFSVDAPAGTALVSNKTAYTLRVCIGLGDTFSGARVQYLKK